MATEPRQRIRVQGSGNEPKATPPNDRNNPGTKRRKYQKKSRLMWEMIGACLFLLLLFFGSPSRQRRKHKKPPSLPNSWINNQKSQQQIFEKAAGNESLSPSIQQQSAVGMNLASKTTTIRPALTAFLEPRYTLNSTVKPLPPRQTSADRLTKIEYPAVKECSRFFETFPIDNFSKEDPFLPWIHDVFPSSDGTAVHFVAQNKRRCDTGEEHEETMSYWEPQIALMQPVRVIKTGSHPDEYRLASPSEPESSGETRFLCRFHYFQGEEETTLSEFPFNYEYVSWRKGNQAMFSTDKKDMSQFWLSQLMFSCPVPEQFQRMVQDKEHVQDDISQLFVDIIPIRTPARKGEFLFNEDHVGDLIQQTPIFDTKNEWGASHILPKIENSGRWANIPICLPPPQSQHHRLTACTWTSASYTRRGDVVSVNDTEKRLREWIAFHTLVGFDRLIVYDNTADGVSQLDDLVKEYENVIYHRWPCQICNNNRPMHKNPGERSSQYAAEASCRERYGPSSDWMAFIDTDEYLVPMDGHDTWDNILKDMEQRQKMHVLKMRSSRGKPILALMEPLENQSQCKPPESRHTDKPDECVAPKNDETFLKVYNCDFIRPPKPERFERAMKQIYRPDYVLSHFVHYSTVTKDIARLRKDFGPKETYTRKPQHSLARTPEKFLDEKKEGALIHARSVLPEHTMRRTSECYLKSKFGCNLGYPCPDSVEFVDELHQDNVFQDEEGNYCNCWKNSRVGDFFVPKLEEALGLEKAGRE